MQQRVELEPHGECVPLRWKTPPEKHVSEGRKQSSSEDIKLKMPVSHLSADGQGGNWT